MGTGRIWRKKSLRRPKKSGAARRRRQLEHRRKLVALGEDKAVVAKLDPKAARMLLAKKASAAARKA